MREYRKTHILTTAQLNRRRLKGREHYKELRENPEWIKKSRILHKGYSKKYRLKPGIREKATEQRRKYYQTENGKKAILRARKKYESLHISRKKAWAATTYAKRMGKIKSLPCKVCGDINTHAHHPDPYRKLEVIFLCPLHHRQEHL